MEQQPGQRIFNSQCFTYADNTGSATSSTVSYTRSPASSAPRKRLGWPRRAQGRRVMSATSWRTRRSGSSRGRSSAPILDRRNAGLDDRPTSAIGIQSVLDGTSNTAMFSERLIGVAGNPSVLKLATSRGGVFQSRRAAATISRGDVTRAKAVINGCTKPATDRGVARLLPQRPDLADRPPLVHRLQRYLRRRLRSAADQPRPTAP